MLRRFLPLTAALCAALTAPLAMAGPSPTVVRIDSGRLQGAVSGQ